MMWYRNVDFMCMDSSPLADSLKHEITEWITQFGNLLHDTAKTNMQAIQAKLDKFAEDLITDPDDLEDLKAVLQVCNAAS